MKFSYNFLKEYIPQIPPAKKMAENLMMRAFEVESVNEADDDFILDIKILPNRAFDCLSHLGLAREIAAIEKVAFVQPKINLKESKDLKIKDYLTVHVGEPELCSRYSARVILEVSVGRSPNWLKERLEACGLRSINNIVDITNYVMLECGQPLHAFDLDKLTDKKIVVRLAQKSEKINTLDEGKSSRALNENILVIADTQKPIAIAGIKGGRGPEIDEKTKRIVLEAANFNAANIRKSSKALNLRTDASIRFENSVDRNLTSWALDRAAAMIVEIAGGQTAAGILDVGGEKKETNNNGVSHNYIEKLLGIEIKSEEVVSIFGRLGLEKVKKIKKGEEIFYEICVPSRRADLLTSEDLIEEIGRLHGYERVVGKMPQGVLIPVSRSEELVFGEEVRNLMAGLGFSEVYNYSFVGEPEQKFYKFQDLIEISNPLSQDQKYLRPNLAAGFIKNLKENLRYFHAAHGLKELRLFEVGRIFFGRQRTAVEEQKIGGLVYFKKGKNNQSFYELKGAVENLFEKLGLTNVWEDNHLQEGLPANWQEILNSRKTSQIKAGDELIGWLGVLNKKVFGEEKEKIEGETAIFEIDFARLIKLVKDERSYQPPSPFPAITRDLAILVGAEVKIDEVLNVIENAAGELLADTDLFDLYEGEDLKAEKKSLAFHLIWQSDEKTLSDGEVNKQMEKIMKALEEQGWEIRK